MPLNTRRAKKPVNERMGLENSKNTPLPLGEVEALEETKRDAVLKDGNEKSSKIPKIDEPKESGFKDGNSESVEENSEMEIVDEETFFRETFGVIDKNNDGVICREDLKALFASMNEDHSDYAIGKMIGKFNDDGSKNVNISLIDFKEKLAPKLKTPIVESELLDVFQKVRDITDGIHISDSDNNPQNEVIELDMALEALDENVFSCIGHLSKPELKVIFQEMKDGGVTYGIPFSEFSELMEECCSNPYVLFGALLCRGHNEQHRAECEEDTEIGMSILDSNGCLISAFSIQEDSHSSKETPSKDHHSDQILEIGGVQGPAVGVIEEILPEASCSSERYSNA